MPRRLAVPLAPLMALLLGLPPAGAAPRSSCPMLADPAGDSQSPAGSRTLDIVSGDVSSTARELTVILRVAQLRPTDPEATAGLYYRVQLTLLARGRDWADMQVDMLRGPDGTSFKGWVGADRSPGLVEGYGRSTLLTVSGTMDEDSSEIRFVTQLAEIGRIAQVHRGAPAELTGADSWYGVAWTGQQTERGVLSMERADSASGGATHRLGSRACVP